MSSYEELKKHAEIKGEIAEEMMRLPAYLMEAAEKAAENNHIKRERKIQLDKLVAEMTHIELENNPRQSDTKLKMFLPLDERYNQMTESLSDAELSAGLWQGLVDAFKAKQSMLKELAQFVVAGYLAPTGESAYDRGAYEQNVSAMAERRRQRADK